MKAQVEDGTTRTGRSIAAVNIASMCSAERVGKIRTIADTATVEGGRDRIPGTLLSRDLWKSERKSKAT